MKYLAIIERGETGYGAYVPDLPGCVAAGDTREEALRLIKKAIEFHIKELCEMGEPIPESASASEIIEVNTT